MKLSARNQLKGKIVEVKKGATTAHVRIDVGGQIVTASITNELADELKLSGRPDRLCHRQGEQRDGGGGLSMWHFGLCRSVADRFAGSARGRRRLR